MAQSFLDRRCGSDRRLELSGDLDDASIHRLTSILPSLVGHPHPPFLPDWTYTRWCRILQYPDLCERAQALTRELGRERDKALADPALRSLVEWAGSRRRSEPAAGAAAALTLVGAAQVHGRERSVDVSDLARRVAIAVDTARAVGFSSRRRTPLLSEPDWLAAIEQDPARSEDPRLSATLGGLLRLAGVDSGGPFATRVGAAVVQAGDWWACHAIPVPVALGGPCLPGVVPAQSLREVDRLSAHMSDTALLFLVAGPQPGRNRPCQVAWRRGLTFWAAVRLSGHGSAHGPSADAVRWWRTELAALGLGPAGARCPSAPPVTATAS